jgi:hypothetical protein
VGQTMIVLIRIVTGTGTVTSVTDNLGNTYSLVIGPVRGGADATTYYAYSAEITTGGSLTVTANFSGSFFYGLSLYRVTSDSVLAPDATNSATGTTWPPNPGSVTPSQASALLIAGCTHNGFGDAPAGTSYTLNDVTNSSARDVEQYRIVTSIASYSGAFGSTDPGGLTVFNAILVSFVEGSEPATVALTGTVTASITEADIIAGGKTVILTVANDTVVPASTPQTIGYIANALGGTTDTTSFSITLPTTQAGDIILLEFCHRGTADGTVAGTSVTTGGLTWTLKHSQLFATSTFSGKLYWTRATGNHSGQTVTGSGLTNACAAIVTIYRNVIASGDPFTNAATIVGEENASGNETQAEITTLVDGCMVCLTVLNSPDVAVATQAATSPAVLAERAELLSTGGTDASIAHASELKATAGATGALTWTQTNAASGSYAYALQPVVTTPFADARAAIISGIDSAQSEGGGWDAKVKPNIPVASVVRTSDTVITITLQAQSDYDISAQETITATVPATALVGAEAVVATPTFTISLPPEPTTGGYQLNYHR